MPTLEPMRTPTTQSGGAGTTTNTRTVTIVCEECETPREVSDAVVMRWQMNTAYEPERTCRICGLTPARCPVGGM